MKLIRRFVSLALCITAVIYPVSKHLVSNKWTNSYFVSTVGGAPLETVKMYIQNQKET